MKMTKKTLLACGMMMALNGTANAVNVLTNGGFEDPVVTNPLNWDIFPAIPGWTGISTCGGIEIQRNGVSGQPFEGLQLVELDSNCPSSMYQDVTTGPGVVYRLAYHYSPRPGVNDNSIDVSWDGTSLGVLNTSGLANTDTVWEQHTHLLQASAASSHLQFTDLSAADGVGGYIDDVFLEPLDSPKAICDAVKAFVSSKGIANALCAKLNAASAAMARGNNNAKAGPLRAFVNQVKAQSGKHIPADVAELLIVAAKQL